MQIEDPSRPDGCVPWTARTSLRPAKDSNQPAILSRNGIETIKEEMELAIGFEPTTG